MAGVNPLSHLEEADGLWVKRPVSAPPITGYHRPMDSMLLMTLTFIFLTAFVGIVIKRRHRDRCLKDFEAFRVTTELHDRSLIWGRLAVFPNGIELFYPSPAHDKAGHHEFSYIAMADKLANVQAIYRYHDELSDRHKAARLNDIERTHHPNLGRRALRWARNLLNTFGDAFNQSMGAWLASAKKSGQSQVIKTQDKQIRQIGTTVLGAVANAYEPILERYIGRRVVVEERRGDTWVEHAGILKEYTAKWIEILDVRAQQDVVFDLSEAERLQLNDSLDFVVEKRPANGGYSLALTVENHSPNPIIIKRCEGPGFSRELGALVPAGGAATEELTDLPQESFAERSLESLPNRVELRSPKRRPPETHITPDRPPPLPGIKLVVQGVRHLDLLLPRARAVLRHGGEPLEPWYERLRRRQIGD